MNKSKLHQDKEPEDPKIKKVIKFLEDLLLEKEVKPFPANSGTIMKFRRHKELGKA